VTGGAVLPLTYDECRARFRRAAAIAGHHVVAHPISARGPAGQELTIDTVTLGAEQPERALVVLSGVHGVEGFVTSQMQIDLVSRWRSHRVPDGVGVVVVHAVNPWGMAWWRRQNESNVDLNRNWRRSDAEPSQNDDYDLVHRLVCPDTDSLPDIDELRHRVRALVAQRGADWVTRAITAGQYRHPDGLHYGGERTEESNRVLESILSTSLGSATASLVLDLHTGDGPPATTTFLSDHARDTWQDGIVRRIASSDGVRHVGPGDGRTLTTGSIASGIGDLLAGDSHVATTVEWGTVSDMRQLIATHLESWVHRRGDRSHPDHAAVAWAYRCCFTPDDEDWTRTCRSAGATVLDRAVDVIASWPDAPD
jgi:polar amino acid transport system ATP-binding protein